MKLKKLCCLCVFVALPAFSAENRVTKKQVLDFLKVELRHERFRELACVGNSPSFRITNNPNCKSGVEWQRKIEPEKAPLTFRAILNIDGEDKLIVGHLNVIAHHALYWLSNKNYIGFSISMNQWHFSGDYRFS